MTGFECLKAEMKKRGIPDNGINSKAVATCIDILAQTGTAHLSIWQANKEADNIRMAAQRKADEIDGERLRYERLRDSAKKEYDEIVEEIEVKIKEADEYFKKINNALEECESEEGRDALRLAQMYMNSVEIETKYDNTAFIIGLAAILSGKKIKPIDELKKINKKMPEVHFGDFGIVRRF